MTRSRIIPCATMLLALAHATAGLAQPITCHPLTLPPVGDPAPPTFQECDFGPCYVGYYPIFLNDPEEPCDHTGLNWMAVGFALEQSPAPAMLSCTRDGHLYSCAAYPVGGKFTFGWEVDDGLQMMAAFDGQSNLRDVVCTRRGGVLTVGVVSPTNTMATQSLYLDCEE